ncbi:MAG: hypothetical protein U0L85_01200 [Bacilli bacterium]|nr:hypothetical protein [Bacilli bacterium]
MFEMYDVDQVKSNLEQEVEFIFNNVDDPKIIESLERIRISYFIYYNMLKELKKEDK